MGCNCGSKNRSSMWVWTSKDGSQKVGNLSEVQAKAKVARLGGTANPA